MSDAVRRCPVCEHPSVLGINQAILNGKSYRAIARDWKIGSEASGEFRADHKKVVRHAEKCMATSYQEVQKTNLTAQGEALTARLKYLDEQVDTVIQDALRGHIVMVGDTPMLDDTGKVQHERSIPELRALLAAVREGRQNAALRAKLAGALPEEDPAEMEAAQAALANPEVRRLLAQVEETLAAQAQAAGHNALDN